MENKRRFILAFDSLSALAGGILTFALSPFLQALHHWTPAFTHYMASVNLGYGLYAGALRLAARKAGRVPPGFLVLLVAGNGLWAFHCLLQAWRLRAEASYWGIGHLLFEAAYVGILAVMEARIFFRPRT